MGEIMAQITQQEEKPAEKQKILRKTFAAITAIFAIANGTVPIFRELLETLKEAISDEIPIEIHQDKLVLRVMDASRIKMANFVLHKEIFEEWHVTNKTKFKSAPLPARIFVGLDDLIYTIEAAGKDAKARFQFNLVFSTVKRPIRVTVRKPEKCPKCGKPTDFNILPKEKQVRNKYKCGHCKWRGKVRKWERTEKEIEVEMTKDSNIEVEVTERTREKYSLKVLEPSKEEIPLPRIIFDAKFKLVAKDFQEKLKRMLKKTDHTAIVGSDKELKLLGESDTLGIDVTLEKGSDILLVAEANSPQKAKFSLAELISIMPKPKVADIVGLEYTTDMPMRVSWFTSLGSSTIEFYLAPRLDVDL